MTLDELRTTKRAFITVADAASLYELDERTVRKGCERGDIPSVRVGMRIRIPVPRLLALLEGAPDMTEVGPASPTVATTDSDSGGPSREHFAMPEHASA